MSADAIDPEDAALLATFERFAAAVQRGDLAAFEALCAADVSPQRAVFERDSARVREGGWRLAAREIRREGEVGEVVFELLGPDGARIDTASVTFTREPGGWRLRTL